MYRSSNPKIDIFCNEKYLGSTNWFKTAGEALMAVLKEFYGIVMPRKSHRYAVGGKQFLAVVVK